MTLLFYTKTNPNNRKFFIAILSDVRSITERALLQLALYLVNLQGIVAPYPQAHLLIVEIVKCDAFLQSEVKKIDNKSVF